MKTILPRMAGEHKSNWHLTLFSTLCAFITSIKTTTRFTPFQLVCGMESILPIEWKIPSLKLVVELFPNTSAEEERFIYLAKLDETQWDDALDNESHKKHIKAQYDKSVQPRLFNKGDLILMYY